MLIIGNTALVIETKGEPKVHECRERPVLFTTLFTLQCLLNERMNEWIMQGVGAGKQEISGSLVNFFFFIKLK